ncbi:MAG: T9SS type A sorting domain-containing protein [Bacteroidetes bacterium]|nr:T9SS type A sorting domain-containing protein [Bacteroidota bacterium]
MIDTLQLAYNGAAIGAVKSDIANPTATDTLGSDTDTWAAALTPAMLNDNSFGLFLHGTGTGVCTFSQFSITMTVYYCDLSTGIHVANQKLTMKIFPNPVSESLIMEATPENIGKFYSIFDYTGKLIESNKIAAESTRINTEWLSSGMYFIRINGEYPQTLKFIRK